MPRRSQRKHLAWGKTAAVDLSRRWSDEPALEARIYGRGLLRADRQTFRSMRRCERRQPGKWGKTAAVDLSRRWSDEPALEARTGWVDEMPDHQRELAVFDAACPNVPALWSACAAPRQRPPSYFEGCAPHGPRPSSSPHGRGTGDLWKFCNLRQLRAGSPILREPAGVASI